MSRILGQICPEFRDKRLSGQIVLCSSVLFCFFAEPTPSTSQNTKKRNQLSEEKKQKFHEVLKKSVIKKQTSLSDDSLPTEEVKVAQQMKQFDAAVSSSSRQKTYIYCLIGRNLTELKRGKKGKKFIEFVHHFLPASHYSRSQIYFLMNLHDLALKYNKLMYVSIGIGILKSKYRIVKQLLGENEDFWSRV